jgi:multidrug efflux pump subunit AcrA (membrane-fusion protein)
VKITLGDKAELTFDAYPGQPFNAQVSEIAESADPTTGTFEIELAMVKSEWDLKTGFVAKGKILPSKQPAYYKIPSDAIVDADDHDIVIFVPDEADNKAKEMHLTPYFIGNDFVAVLKLEGLSIERVITDGAKYLKEGAAFTTSVTADSDSPKK